jgi:hypothetical protein
MAAKGGPLILLGGLAALLMLKKKDKGSSDVDPEVLDSVEEGEAIEEAEEKGEIPPAPKPDAMPGKIPGNPPNMSGHPWGYDAIMFPTPGMVRMHFNSAGYKMPIVEQPPPKDLVKAFQSMYNTMTGPKFPGILHVDGIAGKHTLNALQHWLAA